MMRIIFSILFFTPILLFGQNRVIEKYYDSKNNIVLNIENANFIIKTTINDSFPNQWIKVKIDILDSIYVNRELYKEYYNVINTDTFCTDSTYYDNTKIKSIINYKNKKFNGVMKTFYKNGNIKRIDNYENSKLISGKCFKLNGEDTNYYNYFISPRFKGGEDALIEHISENLIYPEREKREGTEATVLVVFIVEYDGTISGVTADGNSSEAFENSAKAIMKKTSGLWESGSVDGIPVKTRCKIPINFFID